MTYSKIGLNEESEYELKKYVEKINDFMSTPFSKAGVDRLVKIGVKFLK